MIKNLIITFIKKINVMKINFLYKCKIKLNCNINLKSEFGGKNTIHSGTIIGNCKIGFGTYMGENCRFYNTYIGKYCSIAEDVKLVVGLHPTKTFVSTHPAFFSTLKQSGFSYVNSQYFEEHKYTDESKSYMAEIGNDVWIGEGVRIIAGNKIGNGVIVGSQSLVTKDCDPYGIYAGIPAKKIGQRFDEETIKWLESFRWWEKDNEWIKENSNLFIDIQNLKQKFEGDQV